jgi:hypothetical protein
MQFHTRAQTTCWNNVRFYATLRIQPYMHVLQSALLRALVHTQYLMHIIRSAYVVHYQNTRVCAHHVWYRKDAEKMIHLGE